MRNQTEETMTDNPTPAPGPWTPAQYDAYNLGMQTEREHQNRLSKLAAELHAQEVNRLLATIDQLRAENERLERELSDSSVWGQACDDVAAERGMELDQLRAELAKLREAAWEPVDRVELWSGREVYCDESGVAVGRGNNLHNAWVWPRDGYTYRLCRRVVGQEE